MTARDKEILNKCYKMTRTSKANKENVKIDKVIKDKKAPVDNSPSPKEGIVMAAGSTRNELMLQAKEKGVKNFRVLSKQELTDVLANIGDQAKVDAIVSGAVQRWHSGWGKKKQDNAA
jgi:hypothetical protein